MAKKKTKAKRPARPGADAHQRKQERLEARREERARALAAQRRAEQRRRYIRYGLIAVVAVAALWFLFLRTTSPTEIRGHEIEQVSTAGVQQHTQSEAEIVEYETSPPVSGEHWRLPAPCGTHATQVDNEEQVHSLEHGAVGIQYDPELDPADIEAIEAIVGDYGDGVFSGPYIGMDTPIAVTSWSRIMRLDSLDEAAIREYVDAFRNKGPESGAEPCPGSTDEAFDPSASSTPGAGSPAPSESPGG